MEIGFSEPSSTIFPKYLYTMEEVEFFSVLYCHGANFSLALPGRTRWLRYSWTRDRGSQLYDFVRFGWKLFSY